MAYLGENSQNELDSVRMPSQGKRMNAPVNRQLKEKDVSYKKLRTARI